MRSKTISLIMSVVAATIFNLKPGPAVADDGECVGSRPVRQEGVTYNNVPCGFLPKSHFDLLKSWAECSVSDEQQRHCAQAERTIRICNSPSLYALYERKNPISSRIASVACEDAQKMKEACAEDYKEESFCKELFQESITAFRQAKETGRAIPTARFLVPEKTNDAATWIVKVHPLIIQTDPSKQNPTDVRMILVDGPNGELFAVPLSSKEGTRARVEEVLRH